MPSIIQTGAATISATMPTPESLKPGAQHINATSVGPSTVNSIGIDGQSMVENAQISAEQSYSAMAAATAGGGQDPTVEFMLENAGKSL